MHTGSVVVLVVVVVDVSVPIAVWKQTSFARLFLSAAMVISPGTRSKEESTGAKTVNGPACGSERSSARPVCVYVRGST